MTQPCTLLLHSYLRCLTFWHMADIFHIIGHLGYILWAFFDIFIQLAYFFKHLSLFSNMIIQIEMAYLKIDRFTGQWKSVVFNCTEKFLGGSSAPSSFMSDMQIYYASAFLDYIYYVVVIPCSDRFQNKIYRFILGSIQRQRKWNSIWPTFPSKFCTESLGWKTNYNLKQECIPVGCSLPYLGGSLTGRPPSPTPVDRMTEM